MTRSFAALGASVYQQGGAAPEDGTRDAASGDDDIIDADFTESK